MPSVTSVACFLTSSSSTFLFSTSENSLLIKFSTSSPYFLCTTSYFSFKEFKLFFLILSRPLLVSHNAYQMPILLHLKLRRKRLIYRLKYRSQIIPQLPTYLFIIRLRHTLLYFHTISYN
jgi:hypothetical protein